MKNVRVTLAILGVVVLAAIGIFLLRGSDTPPVPTGLGIHIASTTPVVPLAISESTPPTEPATVALRSYKNSIFHFGLLYPKELAVREYKENGGALTVTFTDTKGEQSFQIYVTPYTEKVITDERFRLDEPSGVYLEPTDVMVDNVRATMFFSKNFIMGDTREVWFIRKGYLYEVTTYKELDEWLGHIMQTWKFI